MVFTIYRFFFHVFLPSFVNWIQNKVILQKKEKKKMNDVAHTHNQTIRLQLSGSTGHARFSLAVGLVGLVTGFLFYFLFFGCAWSIMRSALFHSSLVLVTIRILQKKYPQKNKSDNKQQSQNEITWPEADRFPPISYTAYQSLKRRRRSFTSTCSGVFIGQHPTKFVMKTLNWQNFGVRHGTFDISLPVTSRFDWVISSSSSSSYVHK